MNTTTNTNASCAADRYTKKPVTIDAIRWTGKNLREVITFTDGPPDTRTSHAGMAWDTYVDLVERDGLKIFTLEGKMSAAIGDWIIKGVQGEFYPCKPDIFEATYSPALAASAPAPQPASPPTAQAEGWTKTEPLIARSHGEWHEDDGPVVWWSWDGHAWAGESPWCGTPLDSDWPGYHTHWTPAPPAPTSAEGVEHE